ncbi:hypothetical protein RIR_jg28965.t1 [Rhizophagus irregularis DAOM 181602=DAOM 197198]|uniref:Uncharacterized protein n=1 Tax=Rhizophagus irregularis (strain DAOM 181602 / DAOM 197198 / MUCL 43194) TaxID=747089 RepID=U9TIT5_RHIID|nr:hypothetical protein RIR_jg28965.t1 [Rhizophagus irregularis DAOM 181602=DAOM 197198]
MTQSLSCDKYQPIKIIGQMTNTLIRMIRLIRTAVPIFIQKYFIKKYFLKSFLKLEQPYFSLEMKICNQSEILNYFTAYYVLCVTNVYYMYVQVVQGSTSMIFNIL